MIWRKLAERFGPLSLAVLGVIVVFWKLALTKQYTFLESPDLANQVLPWLQAQAAALRQGSILLWDPYAWFGQSLVGQLQPGVTSAFTYLLALAPFSDGHVQIAWVHRWFVLMHCVAAVFAYLLFRDLSYARSASALGGLFYATAGFCGNTEWPQIFAAALWAPLVFLFLLRALRGRNPHKSAAWAGVALGLSWLSGHHAPSLYLTLAVAGVCVVALARSRRRLRDAVCVGIVFSFLLLTSAVQLLPAMEYGRLAVRWTATGVLAWDQKVEVPEHENAGFKPSDLLHVVMPGSSQISDPFVGCVGLGLAAVAVWGAFRRWDVRLFTSLGLAALLFSMARNDVLYGPFYAFVPLVEKARSPVMALSIVHFAIAGLVAYGSNLLLARPDFGRQSGVQRAALWFGGMTLALFEVVTFLRPTVTSAVVEGDSRLGMIAFIALLLAVLLQASSRGHVGRNTMALLLGILIAIEQGNEVGWAWAQQSDRQRTLLKPLEESRDLADFLRTRPGPSRVEVNPKDLQFNFGDWYGLETVVSYLPSVLAQTERLSWWPDRVFRMYGIGYTLSRSALRPGQQDVFTGRSGLKIFANPEAFPRAWTVHRVQTETNPLRAVDVVRDGPVDLRTTAVMAARAPGLEQCAMPDRVLSMEERPSFVRVKVQMACAGMLVVSDNWYPGWRGEIDGSKVAIEKVNTVVRGVVVSKGWHEVTMRYRPAPVYWGLAGTLLGLCGAVFLQTRRETGYTRPARLP